MANVHRRSETYLPQKPTFIIGKRKVPKRADFDLLSQKNAIKKSFPSLKLTKLSE